MSLSGIRLGFLFALLLLAIVNYIPTRYWILAVLAAISWPYSFKTLCNQRVDPAFIREFNDARWIAWIAIPITAWGVLVISRNVRSRTATDQLWSRFRDTFGAVWALRLREQFNAAAQNVGWPVRLGWFGLVPKTENPDPEWHAAIVALMKRFKDS